MTTDTLLLRPIRTRDAGAYYEIFGDPEICRYDDFSPITEDESVEDIVRIIDAGARQDRNSEQAIERVEDRQMVGVFTILCGRRYRYIGYHFKQTCWGRGYATQIVRLFMDSLKPRERLLIRAKVDTRNAASIRVLEKCGFRRLRSYKMPNGTHEAVYQWIPAVQTAR